MLNNMNFPVFFFLIVTVENPILFRPDFRFVSNYTWTVPAFTAYTYIFICIVLVHIYNIKCITYFYFNDHDNYRACRHGRRTRTTRPLKTRVYGYFIIYTLYHRDENRKKKIAIIFLFQKNEEKHKQTEKKKKVTGRPFCIILFRRPQKRSRIRRLVTARWIESRYLQYIIRVVLLLLYCYFLLPWTPGRRSVTGFLNYPRPSDN